MRILRTVQGLVILAGLVAGGYAVTKPGSDVLLLPAIWAVCAVVVGVLNDHFDY